MNCRECGADKEDGLFPQRNGKRTGRVCQACTIIRQAAWLKNKRRKDPNTISNLPDNASSLALAQKDEILRRIQARVTVNEETECHEWKSYKNRVFRRGGGYPGMDIKLAGKWFHFPICRIVAALFHGLDLNDSSHHACHECDNTICVSHEHIFLGDNQINQQDRCIKHGAGLTKELVSDIRRRLADGQGPSSIARLHNVTPATISAIKKGSTWNYV